MAAPLVIGGVKIAGSILLPFLLKALGKKTLPVLASKSATAVATKTAPGIISTLTPSLGKTVATQAGTKLAQEQATKALLPTILRGTGKGLNAVGTAGTYIAPFALLGSGRLLQGAGTAAGGLLAAGSNLPSVLSQTPDAKQQLYGTTPLDQLGQITSGLGQAAGVGLSAIAGGAGSTVSDLGNSLRLANVQSSLNDRNIDYIRQLQQTHANPAVLNNAAQMMRSSGRM